MASGGIPDDVRRLIVQHIHSVEQLEVLLLFAKQPERELSAEDVGRQLVTSTDSIAARIADLERRGFVRAVGGGRFRYDDSDPRRSGAVSSLGAAYARRRVSVIGLIFSKPSENIVTFADAFRLRKDDD